MAGSSRAALPTGPGGLSRTASVGTGTCRSSAGLPRAERGWGPAFRIQGQGAPWHPAGSGHTGARLAELGKEVQAPERAAGTPAPGPAEEAPGAPAEEQGGIPIPSAGLLQVAERRRECGPPVCVSPQPAPCLPPPGTLQCVCRLARGAGIPPSAPSPGLREPPEPRKQREQFSSWAEVLAQPGAPQRRLGRPRRHGLVPSGCCGP
uniref:Uncharacterized protein n=1 Tax=Apteryx owenii TaxID=8824 RepID=A0A8B9PF51_APTOW